MRRRLCAPILAAASLQLLVPPASSRETTAGGSPSDFVALYYKLYWHEQALGNGSSAPTATADADAIVPDYGVPDDVAERLSGFSLRFDALPPLLQRAVLWDAGYVPSASGDGELVTIRTDCERASTMAAIALSPDEMADASCSSLTCSTSSPTSTHSWTASQQCKPMGRLESLIKCAATSVGAAANTDVASIWSTGNGPMMKRTVAPSLLVWRHDAVLGPASSILAIHSASDLNQVSKTKESVTPGDVCAAASTVIIPCTPYTASSSDRWCRPESSALLTRWLHEYVESLDTDTAVKAERTTSEVVESSASSSNYASVQDGSGVAINPGFVFDGRSSDLSQQFYRHHVAGDDIEALALTALPEDVEERLNKFALQFSDLPPLLQRALLWDFGYVLANDGTVAQVYAECGRSMGDLMSSTAEVQDAGCTTQTCTSLASTSNSSQSDGSAPFWHRAARCNEHHTLVNASRCAVRVSDGAGSIVSTSTTTAPAAIWARGVSEDTVPNPRVYHWMGSPSGSHSQSLFALQVTDSAASSDSAAGSCASLPEMVIPCAAYSADTMSRWCRPVAGELVTSWLQRVSQPAQESSSSQGWLTVALPVAAIVVLLLATVGFRYRKVTQCRVFSRWRRSTDLTHLPNYEDKTSSSATVLTPDSSGLPSPEAEFLGAFSDPFPAMVPNVEFGIGNDRSGGWIDQMNGMKKLLESPYVRSSVIAFPDLKFHHLIGRGSCGEVWLCILHEQRVAAKRLLKRRRKRTPGALEAFTSEILLTASLRHPHIVRYLGIASSTLHNLWLVTEYMETGDLHHCLQSFGAELTWRREKLRIAIGIARGLCYLHHDVRPAVIHRDLKTRNVLLTAALEAKLTDFGVSRRRCADDDGDGARTASERSDGNRGTDTPYWTAPEVLQSREYSGKADVYSLGVVLCELDTLAPPYADAKGADLSPSQLLQRIADGLAKPELSAECPPPIVELVARCLERDPSRRPSAVDALDVLGALPGSSLDTFSF